jgi:hypothetical protein
MAKEQESEENYSPNLEDIETARYVVEYYLEVRKRWLAKRQPKIAPKRQDLPHYEVLRQLNRTIARKEKIQRLDPVDRLVTRVRSSHPIFEHPIWKIGQLIDEPSRRKGLPAAILTAVLLTAVLMPEAIPQAEKLISTLPDKIRQVSGHFT